MDSAPLRGADSSWQVTAHNTQHDDRDPQDPRRTTAEKDGGD